MQLISRQLTKNLLTPLAASSNSLAFKSKKNKISYTSDKPYNKRWEFKWKHSYYTYPRDGLDHTYVKKP